MQIINDKIKIDADEMAALNNLDQKFKDDPHGLFSLGTPKGDVVVSNGGFPVKFKARSEALGLSGYGSTPFDAVLDLSSTVLRGEEIPF